LFEGALNQIIKQNSALRHGGEALSLGHRLKSSATKKSHPVKNRNVSRETFSPESKAWPGFFGKMSDSFFAILSLMWALFFTFDCGFG
jgi:hypothetical protein